MNQKLPIEDMSSDAYKRFKERGLDSEILSDETLEQIIILFGIGNPITGRICCDEAHHHLYRCIEHYNPATGIVYRLINEIRKYKTRLDEINRISSK